MLLYEPERFGLDHYLEYSIHEDFSFPFHLHRSLECTLVTSGALRMWVAEREYLLKEGEAVLCLPNEAHGYGGEHGRMETVVFSPDWVPDFMALVDKKRPAAPVFRIEGGLLPLPPDLFSQLGRCLGEPVTASGILHLLCGALLAQTELVEAPVSIDGDKLLHQIIEQVQQNFSSPDFSLKTAARNLGYDYCYLSRRAARALQMPFARYLAQYRIAYAQELLRSGTLTMTEVADRAGFSSIRSFNDAFKRIVGRPPSALKAVPAAFSAPQ